MRGFPVQLDYVYGFPRGGLIPAVYLSHQLDLPLINNPFDPDALLGNILVVDDICDTGDTWLKYTQRAPTSTIEDRYVTLHKKNSAKANPIYAEAVEDNIWIKYPYEKDKRYEK